MSDRTVVLEQAQKICRNLLDLDLPETLDKIRAAIEKVVILFPQLNNKSDKDLLEKRLVEVTGITQEEARMLVDKKRPEPWVANKWAELGEGRRFWRRYKHYLTDEKKMSTTVISRLDDLTDRILDRLADPLTDKSFDRRGLVVGNVQSGKTSNYIGLITKAADAGYNLIVVLAGIHSSLRSQTQLRIDEGFLGYDTEVSRKFIQASNRIGAGRFDPNVPAHSLTSNSLNGDFRSQAANTVNVSLRSSDPVIVVIKKNSSVLKNLIKWLAAKEGKKMAGDADRIIIDDIPLLLIDDEADNASINISKKDVSSINGAIRALLNLFNKSAYVGYTATPYANVFIPIPKKGEEPGKGIRIIAGNQNYPVGEDLFPRDFIVNIPPPSNYIGPEKFFGIESEDRLYEEPEEEDEPATLKTEPPVLTGLYELVADHQPKDYATAGKAEELKKTNFNFIPDAHKKDDATPEALPESLKKAIKCYILACAARRVRGQVNVHNSMLVHVTRFVDWQNAIALKVEEELSRYKNRIEFRNSGFIEELKFLWENEFETNTEKVLLDKDFRDSEMTRISWREIEGELLPAVAKIQVRAVHGSNLLGGLESDNIQPLDYYDNQQGGLSVIAVGGNKLSRGLTLEGLTVSYFLRASKMYDTLMQMGRWFGYRPGYLDLCRLFTTSDLVSYYKVVTAATVEMRAEFDRMWLLKEEPITYGLKVRADSGVLAITAANKFRYTKMMYFGFSGNLEETWQFDTTREEDFVHNYNLADQLVRGLGIPNGPANTSKHLRKQKYVWQGKNNSKTVVQFLRDYRTRQRSFYTSLLCDYIEKQAAAGKLVNWTIAVIDNTKPKCERLSEDFGGYAIGWSYRADNAKPESIYYELPKAHIIGQFHEYIDLNDDQLEKALSKTHDDQVDERKETMAKHPSPLRIRQCRDEKNGLLLIFLLDPRPDEASEPYSSVPIIGLAVSFPEITGEIKVRYAVNQVFEKNLYDYPDELDELEPDEDETEKTGKNTQTSSLSPKTFVQLIENSYQQPLDPTSFLEGMAPEYPGKKEKPEQYRSYKNLVLVPDEAGSYPSLPFYTAKDMQQFYLNASKQVVINPENKYIVEGCYIAGLKQSKYVTFCFGEKRAVFSDSCWVIRPGEEKARYMTALFNSPVFGAWVRVKGERRKDIYYISHDVLREFPLVLPEEDKTWLYDNLYELVVAAARKERERGTENMRNYFADLLNGLIFCTYFPESLQKDKDSLENNLIKLLPRELPAEGRRAMLAQELYIALYDINHRVRKTLYYLDDRDKVSRVRSVFTR